MGYGPFAAAIVAAFVFGTAPPVSAQAKQAGVSAAVRGQVALARVSQNIVGRQIKSGDAIFLGDAITSGNDSGLQIMLLDETVFSIGPNSEISIDQFVYDPSSGAGKVTASVAKGVFRFITGKIARNRPEDMTVRLPTATIGIRGTIVAGAVRAATGQDARVDAVFNGLKNLVPDVENARDFAVLLGPGDENSTNDKGGRFVYTPRGGESAARGRNAGSLLAQLLPGAGGGSGALVSRTGYAVASNPAGAVFGPFVSPPSLTQGMTQSLGAQPAAGPSGRAGGGNTREASNPGNANTLSGNTLARAAGQAFAQGSLSGLRDQGGDIIDPTAGSGANVFSFDKLRQITTGTASASVAGLNLGPFNVASGAININFGEQRVNFALNGITGGGIASVASIACVSSCNVIYRNFTGAAVFSPLNVNKQVLPTLVNTGCNLGGCRLTVGVVDASTSTGAKLNVIFQNGADGPTGSAPVRLDAPL